MLSKKVTVFFDMEAQWESPTRNVLNEKEMIGNILELLHRYDAVAVFNTCGKVMEEYPALIKKISGAGNEISSHGYEHENFAQLTPASINKVLEKTEKACKKVTGETLIGFRPPWLYKNDNLYRILRSRGYRWASCDYVPHKDLFGRPDKQGLFALSAKMFFGIRHSLCNKNPYLKEGILEIPLNSSMDGDLLSLLPPGQPSPPEWIDYCKNSLTRQLDHSGKYFNLNFHPWLIGSMNRIVILEELLKNIKKSNRSEFILARDLLPQNIK